MRKFHINWNRWIELLVFAFLLIVMYKLIINIEVFLLAFQRFARVITPFVAGFVIAYFLHPPCEALSCLIARCRIKFIMKHAYGLSILIVYLLIIILITIMLNYIFPIITRNITEFVMLIPQYYKNVVDFISHLDTNYLPESFDLQAVIGSLSAQELITRLSSGVGPISEYAQGITTGILNTIVTIFLSTILSVYMLLYKTSLLALVNRIVKVFMREKDVKTVKRYLNRSNEIFYKFISTQFLDACVLGTLSTILLSIIGVRYAVTLGILLGICNMIPYFGSIFASAVSVVVTLLTNGLNIALVTGISLLILQQIDGNIIGPKLMGNSLKLNPIWIILSITIGGSYFGVIGMFLSVPIAAMLKVILANLIETRERRNKSTADAM